ncbi:transglutaminase N-terminal domain-containing protein [uncultured Gimesia sp.]|uniref:transglutaminase N-terminal domain-containing protein n=1 Tax=uncultured Gimesia sp. TaxID=1678688 RepID=UPI00260E8D33|nr:transglutaminase N-terminal domain-containing protein [uncultured Gimesia sp.]
MPVCHHLAHLAPRSLPHQVCNEFQLLIHSKPFSISNRKDYFGNDVSYVSIDQAHLGLTVTATSRVMVSPTPKVSANETPSWETVVKQLQKDRSADGLNAYHFVFDSRGVRLFPALKDYAKLSFQEGRPILSAVSDLTERIHNDFTYDPRATTVHTEIYEVFE